MCPSLNMYLHAVLLLFLSWLLLLLPQPTVLAKDIIANIANVTYNSFFNATKQPGCPLECRNISVPYPFGIGVGCSLDSNFEINCSTDSEPFLDRLKVLSISPTQVRVRNVVASRCYDQAGNVISAIRAWARLSPTYTISDTANKFMVFSCDDFGRLLGSSQAGYLSRQCGSICSNSTDMTDLNCPGISCCQINIPKGLKSYNVSLKSFENRTQVWSYDNCSYAFVGELDRFNFRSPSDFSDPNFRNQVPIVLDYAIGNKSCVEASNSNAYLCNPNNTLCANNTESGLGGYLCSCKNGYEGNPYLSPGCTDINECEDPDLNDCDGNANCTNTPGSFTCSCNDHYFGDGRSDGRGCTRQASQISVIKLSLGLFLAMPLRLPSSSLYRVDGRKP